MLVVAYSGFVTSQRVVGHVDLADELIVIHQPITVDNTTPHTRVNFVHVGNGTASA